MTQASSSPTSEILEWQYMKGPDFHRLDRSKTVILLSCSPLEVHGPHLPVLTDIHEAEALMLRTVEFLRKKHPELTFVRLPFLYTAADVVPQLGSLAFRSSTIIRVLCDIGRSLAKQGFRHIWVSSFHGGPRHFVPIDVATHRTNRRYGTKMISLFSMLLKQLTGGSSDLADILKDVKGLDTKDLKGDHHGGLIETSMMLHLLKKYIDPNYDQLPQNTLALKLAKEGKAPLQEKRPNLSQLFRGYREKIKFYETETYSGHPGLATPEIGKEIIEILASHCADALSEVLHEKRDPKQCYSPLWSVRWLFTHRLFGWLFERYVGYRTQVW